MTTPECAIGKDLNPNTCRYIKACRKGYSRNKEFKCVKDSNTDEKTIPVIKEKVKLLKELFSNNGLVNSPPQPRSRSKHLKRSTKLKPNEVNDGLVNSPPQPRSRSKHLKRTRKFHPSKYNEIPNLEPPFRNPFEIELEQFIERNGQQLIKMTFGEAKDLARKEGFVLFSDKDKQRYKNLLVDYRTKIVGIKSKKVHFKDPKSSKPSKLDFDKPMMGLSKSEYDTYKKASIAKMKEDTKDLGYSEQTRFMFYSKSSDLKPGKGTGEHLAPEDEGKFEELSKIKDWRKKLSNFWIAPFRLDGKRWASVEHYYQGSKFKGTPEFYNQFSLDSGSELSKDPLLAKAAGGKTGQFQGKRIRPKEFVIDSDFFKGKPGELYRRSELEMNRAQDNKFIYNGDLMHLLKLTKNAQLVHYQRGNASVIFYNLMKLRSDALSGKLRI
jgi:hypothetical protein